MKNKFIKLTITFMLIMSVFMKPDTTNVKAETENNSQKSIISIDAGRKYFSEDQIKEIINRAYKNGYTSVQILLGNDGLRFVLDDMSLEVDGVRYASESVKKGISTGNKNYYDDPNGDVLYQEEMDRILSYAKERNIDIIPVINSPGHMDAILVTMETLGIEEVRYKNNGKVSARTVNIENEHAVSFVQELIKLYAEYFGTSGASEIFNFGADEYANDVFTSPGWGELQKNGLYSDFIEYANTLSKIIKDQGLLPMSFNDGIYYDSKDEFGIFDKDIIISYWTAGWWGFNVAEPGFFINHGHDILNTNDAWYWVLGNIEEGSYNYNSAVTNAKEKPFDVLPGGKTVKTIGSMQAIWADTPSKDHGMDKILNLMDVFSETHKDKMIRPADYSSVKNALEKIPKDLSNYTQESIEAIDSAKGSVVTGLKVTEQARVNEMAHNIEEAIKNLEFKLADYSKLESIVKQIDALNENNYINFEEVSKAMSLVIYDLKINEQEKVDEMTRVIESALNNLILRKADYKELDRVIEQAKQLDKSQYKNFHILEETLNLVIRNLDILEQEKVDLMTKEIKIAIKNLELLDTTNKEEEKEKEKDIDKDIEKETSVLPQTGKSNETATLSLTLILSGLVLIGNKRTNRN